MDGVENELVIPFGPSQELLHHDLLFSGPLGEPACRVNPVPQNAGAGGEPYRGGVRGFKAATRSGSTPNTTDLSRAGSHESLTWDFAGLRGGLPARGAPGRRLG